MLTENIPADGLILFRETMESEIRLMPNGERVTFSRLVRKPVHGLVESERHSGEGMDTGDRRRAEDVRTAVAITGGGAKLNKQAERVQFAMEAREAWGRITGRTPSPRLEKSWLQLAQDWPLERLLSAMTESVAKHPDADGEAFSTSFIHLLRRWRREGQTGAPHAANPPNAGR